MKNPVLKKISIISILLCFSVLAYSFRLDVSSIDDLIESAYWDGVDNSLNEPTDFDSAYRPFDLLYDSDDASIIPRIDRIEENKIYVIDNAIELYNFSLLCRNENNSIKAAYLSLHYVLGNDINYDDASKLGKLIYPIGYEINYPFTGTFDGQGFEIRNLYFIPIESEEEYLRDFVNIDQSEGLVYYSLFSRVATGASVRNVGLINPIMTQAIEYGSMAYASSLIGYNAGSVSYVYLIDTRFENPGLNVEGFFYLSGLMSMNAGYFGNSYVATRRVKSDTVGYNNGTSPILYGKVDGSVEEKLYYDAKLYLDGRPLPSNIEPYASGILTEEFQLSSNFGEGWFLNRSYTEDEQGLLHNTYPILKGLGKSGNNLTISDATDLIYMSSLIATSGYFRDQSYQITKDIDMNQVGTDAYQAPNIVFAGTFSSALRNGNSANELFTHEATKGAKDYYAIIGLNISRGTLVNTHASYGLFAGLSGKVENINFINVSLTPSDLESNVEKEFNTLGVVSGMLDGGTIKNVHLNGNIELPTGTQIGKTYLGGLVGYGNGVIESSSTNGTLQGGVHLYHLNANQSSLGGLVGYSTGITIKQSYNSLNITGISFTSLQSTQYVGGVIGMGETNSLNEVVNFGILEAYHPNGSVAKLYFGGIIGLHQKANERVYRTNNHGKMNLLIKPGLDAKMAGYGIIKGSSYFKLYSLANKGNLTTSFVGSTNQLTQAELEALKIEIAGVAITEGANAIFQGVFNKANELNVDISICKNVAGVLIVNNTWNDATLQYDNNNFSSTGLNTQVDVTQSYNEADINAYTTNLVTSDQIKISGNILGKNINYRNLRNTGDILVHFSHSTTKALNAPRAFVVDGVTNPEKSLKVVGNFEEVSVDKVARDCFNNGNIRVTMDSTLTVKFNLYISGIAYKNNNSNIYNQYGPNAHMDIISPSTMQGSMHNCVNDGDIRIQGHFYGQTKATGIITMNASLVSSSFNTGDIYNENEIQARGSDSALDFHVDSGGIAYLMLGEYAQIIDSANYGNIASKSTTSNGWVNASGIAVRNEKYENGVDFVENETTTAHFGKIRFTINYGDVHAWNNFDEISASYNIIHETRCKAAGILTLGVLSVVNVVNYGNIYSRFLASGIYGFVFFKKFDITNGEVYIANSINYGKIRPLSGAFNYTTSFVPGTLPVNLDTILLQPNSFSYYNLGALIGKVHTDEYNVFWFQYTIWTFMGTGRFSVEKVRFSYLINFDDRVNIVGKSPEAEASWANNNKTSPETIKVVSGMNRYMATIKADDTSLYPFDAIQTYALNTSAPTPGNAGGIFHKSYNLISPPTKPTYITDEYIADYIQFIPYRMVNKKLAEKIGLDQIGSIYGDEVGIYALSNSAGINNGEFIPDNVSLNDLSPVTVDGQDHSWQFEVKNRLSISDKFYDEMKQLDYSIATTVFDMELICLQDPSIILKKPYVDLENNMITYYVSSNSKAGRYDSTISNPTVAGNFYPVERYKSLSEIQADPKYQNADPTSLGFIYVPNAYNGGGGKYVGRYTRIVNQSGQPLDKDGNVTNDPKQYTYQTRPFGLYHTDGIYKVTFGTRTFDWFTMNYLRSSQTYLDEDNNEYYLYQPERNRLINVTTVTATEQVAPGMGPYKPSGNNYVYAGPTQNTTTTYVKVIEYEPADPETRGTAYLGNDFEFTVNLNGPYTLSSNASFYDRNGNTNIIKASIPEIPGVYGYWDKGTGREEDFIQMSSKYGSVTVYSQAYFHNGEDGTSYEDLAYVKTTYTIRIIRTEPESVEVNTLVVDNKNGLPTPISDGHNITATEVLSPHDGGFISIGFLGYNLPSYPNLFYPSGIDMLDKVNLYQRDGMGQLSLLNPDDQMFYFTDGVVFHEESENQRIIHPIEEAFDEKTGTWLDSKFTIVLNTTELLPSGNYTIQLKLSDNGPSVTYNINFTKAKNNRVEVESITFNGAYISTSGKTSLLSEIPLGIYYHENNPFTKIVDFHNLAQYQATYDRDEGVSQLPSYLTGLEITPYSQVVQTNLLVKVLASSSELPQENWENYILGLPNVVSSSSYLNARYIYVIQYQLQAEAGQLTNFYHFLVEKKVNRVVSRAYQDGNNINPYSVDEVFSLSFERESTPTIRIDYDLTNLYFNPDEGNFITVVPIDLEEGAILNENYFLTVNKGLGYEIYFLDSVPVGEYIFASNYSHSERVSDGVNEYTLNWLQDFQNVSITKLKNNNSRLDNINFVSDSVFSSLSTIIDFQEMDVNSYNHYLSQIDSRPIVTLPNGIHYNDHYYPSYWVIGQVHKTRLEYYAPVFGLPLDAKVVRVINENNLDPSVQETNLNADFYNEDPLGSFKYVHYRVYAENFDINDPLYDSYYTDYYVAVIDVTNNIHFVLDVSISSSISDAELAEINFDKVFVTLNVYQNDETYTGLQASVSSFAYFMIDSQMQRIAATSNFAGCMAGNYRLLTNLMEDYTFTFTIGNESFDEVNNEFVINASVVPRRYTIKLIISKANKGKEWGENEVVSLPTTN